MATGQIHHLQTLSNEDCWKLFTEHAFGNNVDLNDYQDLQTLLLSWCKKLSLLPKNMGSLINLRYLDIEGVPLKEMPQQINQMKHLQFLSNVVLSDRHINGGIKMKRVAELEHLHGILGLENIIDDILDALRPHTNLKHLEIDNYRGTTFSHWIRDFAVSNLVSIKISNCKNCCILPHVGQLAFLKSLITDGCDRVISIGDEIHHKGPQFSCLEVLRIENMLVWKDWSFSNEAMQGGKIFPLLKRLVLMNCPKLSVGLPGYLPSLEHLIICNCEQMVVLLPENTTDHYIPSLYCHHSYR
ncbi:putative disease resistance RPP13-like protein 1 [Humulus lupulus]|uniref:putative disease resistance RPP13-like protein 1 n=1 Tax=Humulus lupulus TaxID=3486 RepID=UPI002B40E8F5|nr:putative disease resistance RPP13-like protein 1 [Humulus lupulus]